MTETVGIIGAGMAGMAAAYRLSQAGFRSVVMEKSRGVSGRAATRRRDGIRYDHGANFFRLNEPRVDQLVRAVLPLDELVLIDGPVDVFDCDSQIMPGDAELNAIAKWSCRGGIKMLGKQLLANSPLCEIELGSRVIQVLREENYWWAVDDEGERRGPFDQLLMTLPPPQAADLCRNSPATCNLAGLMETVEYHRQFSFILGWAQRLPRSGPWHALLNSDHQHPIAWLSFEDDKPGHVPDDQSIMVVQMSPNWTDENLDTNRELLIEPVLAAVRGLLPTPLPDPDWWDSQRWMLAHPKHAMNASLLRPFEDQGLYYAGDALVGKGRVALALREGLDVADRISERMNG